ncbi:hypothetical protein PoB_001935100 [Plakobranchus ocellatus]|uniref:Uncharacterized protein n=1 Tax=Plakobranchus ocellatus TaxID=259542 RepID=A0AAV3ZDY1_9GAST|nr:hypothetical protein PoB_001935100 [Plakobranchus ocellatus]
MGGTAELALKKRNDSVNHGMVGAPVDVCPISLSTKRSQLFVHQKISGFFYLCPTHNSKVHAYFRTLYHGGKMLMARLTLCKDKATRDVRKETGKGA